MKDKLLPICAFVLVQIEVHDTITPTRAIPTEARAHACFDDYSLGITDPMRWHKIKRL